jgi:TPR repeat protein
LHTSDPTPRHPNSCSAFVTTLRTAAPSLSMFSVQCINSVRLLRRMMPKLQSGFSRAADQGLPLAQFVLGGMYVLGQGVPEDAVRAYVWLSLSATQAAQISGATRLTRDAQEMRDALARTMTPAQIDEAQKLAREWKPNPVRDW